MKYFKIYLVTLLLIAALAQFVKYGTRLWNWFPPQDAGSEYSESYERLNNTEKGIVQVSIILTFVLGFILLPSAFLIDSVFKIIGVSEYECAIMAYWLKIFIAAGWISLLVYGLNQYNHFIDKLVLKRIKKMHEKNS